jgi:ribosomal subunit interface protein
VREVDLVLKGRGVTITDQIRRTAEHKLGKIARLDRRVDRVEVEVIVERNPRVGTDGSHRVEIACATKRRTLRVAGSGRDVETALDQALDHLQRQISSYRGKVRDRLIRRSNRLKSPRTSSQGSGSSE